MRWILLPLLAACDVSESMLTCAPVSVDVVDADGAALTADRVEYTVDGGAAQEASCIDTACARWAIEASGALEITAWVGEASGTESVDVEPNDPDATEADGCNAPDVTVTVTGA